MSWEMGKYLERVHAENERLRAENKAMRVALEKAINDYGTTGGPWNVPGEPGTWLDMAKKATGVKS